jgi:hypothetical protein
MLHCHNPRCRQAQQRIMYSQNKEKMKKFMRTLADSKDEVCE